MSESLVRHIGFDVGMEVATDPPRSTKEIETGVRASVYTAAAHCMPFLGSLLPVTGTIPC